MCEIYWTWHIWQISNALNIKNPSCIYKITSSIWRRLIGVASLNCNLAGRNLLFIATAEQFQNEKIPCIRERVFGEINNSNPSPLCSLQSPVYRRSLRNVFCRWILDPHSSGGVRFYGDGELGLERVRRRREVLFDSVLREPETKGSLRN